MTRRFLLSLVACGAALTVVGCGDSKDTKPVTNTAPSGKPGMPDPPPTPPDPNKHKPGN